MLPRLSLQSRESRTELRCCDSVWLATELTGELATALQLPFSPDNQPQIQVSLPQELEELAKKPPGFFGAALVPDSMSV